MSHVLIAIVSLAVGWVIGLNTEWRPPSDWRKHVPKMPRFGALALALWVSIAALLLTSVGMTFALIQVAGFRGYVECRAEFDQRSAQVVEQRREDLRDFVASTGEVAHAAVEGDDPTATRRALDRLEDASVSYLDTDALPTPREACGEPGR